MQENPKIGNIQETLKWNQPSYVPKPSIGTTIRIHWLASQPNQYGLYVHCQTNLISRFKKKYKNLFHYEGNRALIFKERDQIPIPELKTCILMGLTYHQKK